MSMKSWSEYGYGFSIFNGSNLENVKTFLYENNNDKDINPEDILNAETEEDLFEVVDYPCYMIASIINERENISLISGYVPCGETDADEKIGICPRLPWEFKGKEKTITKDTADQILKKYAKMLGITEDPDDFEQEYYG